MKQKTGRKLLGVLLALAMVVGLMPGMGLTAYAGDTTNGVYVNSQNVNETTSGTNWSYNAETKTLTLDNFRFDGVGSAPPTDSTVIMYYPTNDPFTIELKGTNEITQGDGTTSRTWWGIYCRSDLVIKGDGTLDIRTKDGGDRGAAIYCEKNVSIEGTCTVNATSGGVSNGPQGYGIGSGDSSVLTIGKNANVTLIGPKGGTNLTVKNANYGEGWTGTAGTEGHAHFAISTEGQKLSEYKKVKFPGPAPVSYDVIFKVVNGSWNDGEGDAATADRIVTLSGYEGDTLKLAANQIPAVGSKPSDTYKAGSWNVTPSTDTAITAATTYTYTYAAKEASVVTKAPTAKTLTYNGQTQELVTAGTASGGTMQYALGTATEATQPYTTSIPTKTDAGT